jgi:hypothetical protein
MGRLQNRTLIISALALGGACIAGRVQEARHATEAACVRGHFAAAQVIDLAGSMSRRLAPSCPVETWQAFYIAVPYTALGPVDVWTVQSVGSPRRCVCFTWNADTGKLIRASINVTGRSRRGAPLLRAAAIGRATEWACALGLADRTQPYRYAVRTELNGVDWTVWLGSGLRRVTVRVDAVDGSLRYANTWH